MLHLTAKNFQIEVKDTSLPVIVMFYAIWCGKCAMMKTLYNTDVGLTMACAVINFLPPFIFYVFMQSKFKEGMTLSGIKG